MSHRGRNDSTLVGSASRSKHTRRSSTRIA
jgi:hypothetical protein